MLLSQSISFDPADPLASLRGLPEAPGVFALFAADSAAEPYLSKTANLRRRLMRFLRGSESQAGTPKKTKRLQLAHMVARIEHTATGSEFEASLCLYDASLSAFGDRARSRLRLRPPAFLRMSVENPYPRVYPTTKISKSAANSLFGPFPSRAAAEHYAEEMLNLFLLRRCTEDLNPDPAFPGCPYSEMKMCLAPCYKGCSDDRYQQETADVFEFLSTSGATLLARLQKERDQASEELDFERAATIHQRIEKVQGAASLASDAVHPLSQLGGVLVQPAAELGCVALFRLRGGFLNGPAIYSTIGMRLANERSGSTSLFAHPVAIEAVPLGAPIVPALGESLKDALELRLDEALQKLEQVSPKPVSSQVLSDHLALFTRWFYRPVARRVGEIVFAGRDGQIARKPLLRAISRVAARAMSEDPKQLDKPPIQWHA